MIGRDGKESKRKVEREEKNSEQRKRTEIAREGSGRIMKGRGENGRRGR